MIAVEESDTAEFKLFKTAETEEVAIGTASFDTGTLSDSRTLLISTIADNPMAGGDNR